MGNNGAGKTTLFSLMLDLIQATTGFVSIDGIKVNESEAWKNKVSALVLIFLQPFSCKIFLITLTVPLIFLVALPG